MAKVTIVVGLQHGSESKGACVETLCKEKNFEFVVRGGSIQAGHTAYYNGKAYAMQTIPCGFVNPKSKLVMGAGAYIKPSLLEREIKMLEDDGIKIKDRLYIDSNAFLHPEDIAEKEKGMHERMGSTGKGCGEAIKAAIDRKDASMKFRNCRWAQENVNKLFRIQDTVEMLNECEGEILLEGIQGSALSLIHSNDYPYCTGRDTNAATLVAEAGLGMKHEFHVIGVVRTFGIRVAGNSGPMPGEIGWPELAREINSKSFGPRVKEESLQAFDAMEQEIRGEWVMPQKPLHTYTPEEREKFSKELSGIHAEVFKRLPEEVVSNLRELFEITTVTRKLRRIARLDMRALERAIQLNGCSEIYLGFLNYLYPRQWGALDKHILLNEGEGEIGRYIADLEERLGVPITYVSTSATTVIKLR